MRRALFALAVLAGCEARYSATVAPFKVPCSASGKPELCVLIADDGAEVPRAMTTTPTSTSTTATTTPSA